MQRRVYSHPNKVQKTRVSVYLIWFVGLIALAWIFYLISRTYPNVSSSKFTNLRTIDNNIIKNPDNRSIQFTQLPHSEASPAHIVEVQTEKPHEYHTATIDEVDNFVVVFSTDCSPYQDWQTLLLFHSAVVVEQKGALVRIASGCDPQKQKVLQNLYKELYPQYRVHFTPDFKKDPKTGEKYHFYNKPFGVKHWLENSDPLIVSGTVVALVDPDFIFLRPLTAKISGQNNNIISGIVRESEIIDHVTRGKPAAQQYGLGAPWVNDRSNEFNRTYICGGTSSPCMSVRSISEGDKYYSVGPPYILERDDLYRLTKTWCEFVPRVYEGYPDLLAEMYGYSTAAAHENLPHLRMDHYMVSNVYAGGEGWQWIDALGERICDPPVNGIYFPDKPLPTFIHYCQAYRISSFGFAKHRTTAYDVFSCKSPMLGNIPDNFIEYNYFLNDKNERTNLNIKQARRSQFVICAGQRALNAAVQYYKQIMCEKKGISANYSKLINVMLNKNGKLY